MKNEGPFGQLRLFSVAPLERTTNVSPKPNQLESHFQIPEHIKTMGKGCILRMRTLSEARRHNSDQNSCRPRHFSFGDLIASTENPFNARLKVDTEPLCHSSSVFDSPTEEDKPFCIEKKPDSDNFETCTTLIEAATELEVILNRPSSCSNNSVNCRISFLRPSCMVNRRLSVFDQVRMILHSRLEG